MHRVIGV